MSRSTALGPGGVGPLCNSKQQTEERLGLIHVPDGLQAAPLPGWVGGCLGMALLLQSAARSDVRRELTESSPACCLLPVV